MVGLIIVAHGNIAQAFLSATEQICGQIEGIRAIGLDDPVDERDLFDKILKAMKELDHGDGVLILTDMFGGTPANICFSLLKEENVEVLTGMNLPMIIKLATNRKGKNLEELAQIALSCGRENIYSAREILDKQKPD